MSEPTDPERSPTIERMMRAFEAFTSATSTLEQAYRVLETRVSVMTQELEEKNQLLEESLARERRLQAEALQHSRLAAMGEMAATLAHEVRNPLGSMELFASLLLDDLRDRPEARHLVAQIAGGVKDLNHLVTNILGFTRAPVPRPGTVDVIAAIEDALRYSMSVLAEHRVAIVRRYDAERMAAQADPALVRHVFLNLIRNAAQAMEGGGTLTIRAAVGRRVLVSFADTGAGVTASVRERIFDPFFTTKERGTGLGLFVVRTLVEAQGGDITEAGWGGGGACFTVRLPAAPGEHRAQTSDEADPQPANLAAASG
jgi:signal transduction histidine kinase